MITQALSSIGKSLFGIFMDKNTSDEMYKNLVPALKLVCTSKGRSSREAIGLINILAGLPASGAKSLNFKKEYIDKKDGWKNLPSSPGELPFGFWH